ncbi:MAG: phosphoglucosamine mutase [Nitrospirota bacterium]|nr:phosphoglucosamine mutase [Nitrospirota bacterium]MDH5767484.1 phosphoglucosamine mutase [Nitrospirota bacterium]
MKLFGTDGIRGTVNRHPMTPETVLRIGMAAAHVLRAEQGRNMILIGKDTRLSGYMIESALTSGICSMGMNVTLVGPLPTPGIAFLTRTLRLDAGIVISASHNLFEDNGIKFFSSDGFKLPDGIERKIEELVLDEGLQRNRPKGSQIGKAYRLDDATGRYIEYIKSTLPRGMTFEGMKIVVDCANGAAYKTTPWLLRELGVEVISMNDRPDGLNINLGCGSLNIERLQREVKLHKADIGIAHDGDADRAIFCDEKGRIVDGDKIMGMCAVEMKRKGMLKGDTVVSTVMSNLGFEKYLEKNGIELIRTRVGDRYVVKKMIEGGFKLGGEQSGHIVFLDYNTTGDGPLTAVQVLYLMKEKNVYLSKLASEIKLYPQVLMNVDVENKHDIKTIPEIEEAIKNAEEKLHGKGRVLVRPSGTEPKIRVMLEGKDMKLIIKLAENISKVIKEKMT